jgi:uncharacterized protein with PIN domain
VPEVEWTPQEQGWMLALAELDARRCVGCGGDLAETLATEAEDWVPLPPVRCAKCTRIAIEQDDYVKDKTKHMHALRWAAQRRR